MKRWVAEEWLPWLPMHLAPLDGTPIVALFGDYSGVEIAVWGVEAATGRQGWFTEDTLSSEDSSWYAGWVPLPQKKGVREAALGETVDPAPDTNA